MLLIVFLAACGGGEGPGTTGVSGTADSASAVLGAAGGTVVTPSGVAGVQIPPGVISQQATITITRLPAPNAPGQGPLPTSLNQYGPFYQFAISPAGTQLGDSVRVGVCQVTDPSSQFYAPEATHDRLRLAHTVGTTTEILDRVGVNDFLRCVNVTAGKGPEAGRSSRFGRALAFLSDRTLAFLSPASLHAAHGGLGGKVKSFSPFGAVDPLTGLVIEPEFGIAATAAQEDLGSTSYDGTNYLIPFQTIGAQGQAAIEAQLVSPTGTLVAGRIPISGAGGDSPVAAFDGTNHLVVFSTVVGTQRSVLGQFVSRTGALVGQPFTVAAAGPFTPNALVYGGGTYMLAYSRQIDPNLGDFGYRMFVRTISPTGVVGAQATPPIPLVGSGLENVAFDGTNFFVVCSDATVVRGIFVSPTGVVGQVVTIAPAAKFASLAGVAFNGTNYLVSFSSEDAGFDALARLVSPSGSVIGGIINLTNVPGVYEVAVGVIKSGNNFIVSYIDSLSVPGRAAVRARIVSGGGVALGVPIPIASPRNGKVVVGLLTPFSGSKYFATLLRGVQDPSDPGDTGLWLQKDVFGVVVSIPLPPGS
jgi:hypothetical protein